jgi:hypothetical protein
MLLLRQPGRQTEWCFLGLPSAGSTLWKVSSDTPPPPPPRAESQSCLSVIMQSRLHPVCQSVSTPTRIHAGELLGWGGGGAPPCVSSQLVLPLARRMADRCKNCSHEKGGGAEGCAERPPTVNCMSLNAEEVLTG